MQHFISDLAEIQLCGVLHGLVVESPDLLPCLFAYAEFIIDALYKGDLRLFFLFCRYRHCKSLGESFASRLFYRSCHQPALLVVDDIAAYSLAEYLGVSVGVQPVVSYLEGQSEVVAELVQEICLLLVSACYEGSHLCGACDEHSRLEAYHLHVVFHRDIFHLLEVHIVLLALADLCGSLRKQLQYLRQHLRRRLRYELVALDGHHVTRQDGGVLVPLAVYCRHSAAHIRLVHDVVVDKGEAVEHLDSCGRRKNLLAEVILEQRICCKAETRAYPFASDVDHVSERVVQTGRLLSEREVLEEFLDRILNMAFLYHIAKSAKLYLTKVMNISLSLQSLENDNMTIKGEATVVKHTGSHYLLAQLPEWKLFPAVLRGKIRLKGSTATNPVAVGDKVTFEAEVPSDAFAPEQVTLENPAAITSVSPRSNYIIRKSTNLSRQSHIIASNLDRAFIIATIDFPEIKLPFLDRILVTCEVYNVPVTIVLNKVDLYRETHAEMLEAFHEIYEGAGYPVMEVSALTGEGVEELREACKGHVSLFSGVSGVGKSSLIKALDPSLNPRVGEISEAHVQGRHTTTFYEMYSLATGGFIVDTPGLRGFGLVDLKKEEIALYFPEMLKASEECRFTPCTHTHEPGCAVKEAVENGEISYERYSSYLGMLDEEGKYR